MTRLHTCLAAVALPMALVAGLVAQPGRSPVSAAEAAPHVRPILIEVVQGAPGKRLTLTQRAAQRLDIQTGTVERDQVGSLVAPYAAIVYDNTGQSWVYTNPSGLVFMRHKVAVQRIAGETAILGEGPAIGTRIVTVGVPQLYGAEKGIGN
jgi:hypothetical protein